VDRSNKPGSEPGRAREPYISQDMLKTIKLLEHLHRGGPIERGQLVKFFTDAGFKGVTSKKVSLIVDALTGSSLPVKLAKNHLYWADLFDGHAVGRRKHQYQTSKKRMAVKVVDMLIDQTPVVRSLFLGAGTSVLAVAQELIRRMRDFASLDCVYTNNFLAMSELVRHGLSRPIRVSEGEIMMQDGAIISDAGIDSMNEKPFNAVVTGFYGLSFDEGFSSDHQYDRREKLMNLRPANCAKIYIVVNWEKIGTIDQVVATVEEAIDKKKEYFIVTDPPKDWQTNPDHADKLEEIKKWGDLVGRRVVQFVYVERPEGEN
jgi:DeoR/GlpR family transcriptional regulator of sugar metabolism